MFKRSTEVACWVYLISATVGILLTESLYLQRRSNISELTAPYIGQFTVVDLLLLVMGGTLIYGLIIIVPLLARIHKEQSNLTSRAAELEVAVVTDPLTGLYNRRYFEEALKEYLSEFNQTKTPLALLSLDLDHFKEVNDTYGHAAGDLVLEQVASKLKGLTREHDIVARTGGEEFCIVAPFSDVKQIRPFAERICKSVAEMRVDVGDVTVNPTISIGVASNFDERKSAKALFKLSDERLYQAKKDGRNQVYA